MKNFVSPIILGLMLSQPNWGFSIPPQAQNVSIEVIYNERVNIAASDSAMIHMEYSPKHDQWVGTTVAPIAVTWTSESAHAYEIIAYFASPPRADTVHATFLTTAGGIRANHTEVNTAPVNIFSSPTKVPQLTPTTGNLILTYDADDVYPSGNDILILTITGS